MLLTNLKALRQTRGLTQTMLAEQVGVSPGMISYLESHKRVPSFGLTCRLALALGVGLDNLTSDQKRTDHAA
jgi:transcriptional regulator with XRE-family HTH domain